MFSENLNRVLSSRGIHQKQLAQYTGISEATISKFLNNTRQPKYDDISSIARYLQVPVNELFEKDLSYGFTYHCVNCGYESFSFEHDRMHYAPVYFNGKDTLITVVTALEDISNELVKESIGEHKLVARVTVIEGSVAYQRGGEIINLEKGSSANLLNIGEYYLSTKKGTVVLFTLIGQSIVQMIRSQMTRPA